MQRHPDGPSVDLEIEVTVERTGVGLLSLDYRVVGNETRLRIPKRTAAERVDGLWAHTCFEAFVRTPGQEGYWEFNVSPSSQWAAYRFESYRSGMRDADLAPPRIALAENRDVLEVRAEIERLPADRSWELGLAAVIEEEDGTKSYWALAHPPGEPDFHHPDCFALKLPAPE